MELFIPTYVGIRQYGVHPCIQTSSVHPHVRGANVGIIVVEVRLGRFIPTLVGQLVATP